VIAAVLSIAAVTGLLYPLKEVAPAVSLGVVYLVAVLFVASVWGLALGVLCAIGSALAFNWFHIPPTGRFSIAEGEHVVALAVFLVAALVAGSLAELARTRAFEADERRREADEAVAAARAAAEAQEALMNEVVETRALRRSEEIKTTLLRAVSHDLRTPLTGIVASAEALGSSGLEATERRELSEGLAAEARRLSAIVDNLIDLSRLEAQRAEPRRVWVALDEVIDAAAEGLDRARVDLRLDSELPLVYADPSQLERAFHNLLENALDHSGDQAVQVRARVVGQRLYVRVTDRGPGIPEPEQAHIFEPFYRAPAEKRRSAGSGLGLAIVRGFVEANGGEVGVESVPGQGATFVASLPLNGAMR
jgi:two-component system sensor histidine kinase KdpD